MWMQTWALRISLMNNIWWVIHVYIYPVLVFKSGGSDFYPDFYHVASLCLYVDQMDFLWLEASSLNSLLSDSEVINLLIYDISPSIFSWLWPQLHHCFISWLCSRETRQSVDTELASSLSHGTQGECSVSALIISHHQPVSWETQ